MHAPGACIVHMYVHIHTYHSYIYIPPTQSSTTGPRDLPRMIFEFREYAFSRYTIAFSRVHVRPVSDFGRGLPWENSWKILLVEKTSKSDVTDHPPWWFTARKRWYAVHVRWIRQVCVMESLRRAPIMFDITKVSFCGHLPQKLKYSKPYIGFG